MTDRELADAVEIIPDRLYWVALHTTPRNTAKSHYFSVDHDMVYEPFLADFGPLKLSWFHLYCRRLEAKLADPALADKRLIHHCSHDPKRRANAATLISAFQVIALRKSAEAAWEPFSKVYPPFLPFRDATNGICTYQLTILDCLQGLQKGIELGWYDWNRFDYESYDFFEKVDNGDMSWIVPGKFLAFAGPSNTPIDPDGYPAFTPEDYVPIFQEAGIRLVVRLNKKQYDRKRFIDHGIKHVDLYFVDGGCPSREIIANFLHITETEPGPVAVHCKAGLGRTCTLIGLHAMKHWQFPARAFIGWARICRPGSVLGPQQQFLCEMQQEMFQAGSHLRRLSSPLSMDPAEKALHQSMGRLSLRDNSHLEQYEDFGQGERLCGAKRVGLRGADLPGDLSPASRAFGPLPGGGSGHSQPAVAAGDRGALPGGFVSAGPKVGGRAGPPPGGLTAAAGLGGLSVQQRSTEQQLVVDLLRRSLRGIFKHC
mmetsp:Transcript_126190/g.403862  ORF Transcript_126190/g.403862 Transcript_126190/m.403862 type:complete len:484 (-) Transcript_126190:58-1509(-)|eukprot:CAMPEP_0177232470 /NCGR_PEP_ID=MMETSP0367-20130122/43337_1 /TAXON_ID=447022 ORGANISM="Scrippsiella hangoei-like, Strain SHHI-4" /NCGR_SAMPLE_ID=MMETSP0367 /ASSEMBLY_ACC=CAM_ASM_000362 /LENGTH=483 /DNA_ID=CAMNT_0018683113 /DNA_START=169 /DNA_END=1620 /DNA_ORIENTATION=-